MKEITIKTDELAEILYEIAGIVIDYLQKRQVAGEQMDQTTAAQQVAESLGIGRSTLNKYSRSLEKVGYRFMKDDRGNRAYTEHDIFTIRHAISLLSNGVTYDKAMSEAVKPDVKPAVSKTRLEIERTKRGWTKADMASKSFCSSSHYGSVENRRRFASRVYALSMANALSMELKELFDDEGMALLA